MEYLAQGHPAKLTDENGVALIGSCSYNGELSATRHLLSKGESLNRLSENFGLNAAAFHGHWRLCQFLLENGVDVNHAQDETGETVSHAALLKAHSGAHGLVVKVLLARGANPNAVTKPGVEAGAFMRDCRTKGETPLHRATAFADEDVVQHLLEAGAKIDIKDGNGDSPLGWASWYLRPDPILRKLCYNGYSNDANRLSMEGYLLGKPPAAGNSKA